jgi:hypothetical protein
MSIPDFTNTPDEELERIIRTDSPFHTAASHEWQKRQQKRAIDKLSTPHWTTTPAFWIAVFAMLFAAIAALPVIRGWFPSSPPANKAANSQPQQSQSELPSLAKPKTSPPAPSQGKPWIAAKHLTNGDFSEWRMGTIFKVPAVVIYIVAGLWGFFVSLGIVIDAVGFIGGVIAFALFPVTLAFAPWYAALAHGNWFPLILVYGGGIIASVLYAVGAAIDKD